MAQFIKCRFGPLDARRYTYLNAGDPVAIGDMVKVPDTRTDGWKRAEVTDIDVEEPTQFLCKSILGKVTGADVDAAIMAHQHDAGAGQ